MTLEQEHEQKQNSSTGKTPLRNHQQEGCSLTRPRGANEKERLDKWFQHFKNLLGNPEVDTSSF